MSRPTTLLRFFLFAGAAAALIFGTIGGSAWAGISALLSIALGFQMSLKGFTARFSPDDDDDDDDDNDDNDADDDEREQKALYESQTLISRAEYVLRKNARTERVILLRTDSARVKLLNYASVCALFAGAAPFLGVILYFVVSRLNTAAALPPWSFLNPRAEEVVAAPWPFLAWGISTGALFLTVSTVLSRLAASQSNLGKDAERRVARLEDLRSALQIGEKHEDRAIFHEIGAEVSRQLLKGHATSTEPSNPETKPHSKTPPLETLQASMEKLQKDVEKILSPEK